MPKHIEIELSTDLYDFVRTPAQYNHSSVSSTCLGMMGWATNQSYWFDDYKQAPRRYDSLEEHHRKKKVKDESELTTEQTEDLEKLLAIAKLIGIDFKDIASSLPWAAW